VIDCNEVTKTSVFGEINNVDVVVVDCREQSLTKVKVQGTVNVTRYDIRLPLGPDLTVNSDCELVDAADTIISSRLFRTP
jgi:hypothetical protein